MSVKSTGYVTCFGCNKWQEFEIIHSELIDGEFKTKTFDLTENLKNLGWRRYSLGAPGANPWFCSEKCLKSKKALRAIELNRKEHCP